MAESRGRKSRKGRWQLVLGVKESLFALVGVLGLMMMSFAVGTLAGRGDIYRVLHNWGLLGPEAAKAVQPLPPWNLPQAAVAPTPPAAPAALQTAEAPPVGAAPTGPVPSSPQQGSIAPLVPASPPAASAKKAKSTHHKDSKSKEDELRRLREEVAKKLKFQNSLDTAAPKPKAGGPKAKPGEKKAGSPQPVMVAKYRDKKAAAAKVAELRNHGEQAVLKEGKDDKGPYFAVYRQKPADLPKAANSQTQPRTAAAKPKKRGE